jgi:hypothetical protein
MVARRRVRWKLTVRAGPRVQRFRFEDFDAALTALQQRARELADTAQRAPVNARYRRFEPAQQVAGRVELSGPQRLAPAVRAGVDVRGDGSIEAFIGQVRRRAVETQGRETPFAALRRALEPPAR